MGLPEKRMVATCQGQLEGWKKKVNDVASYELKFEVASWEALVKEGFLDSYPATIDHNFFAPLEVALKAICSDQMGKDALKAKIKTVRISSDRPWSSLDANVEGDVLKLDADPSYQRDGTALSDYATRIQTALEKAL